ncbi:heat shock protease domain protein [Rickettsia amblyommatis str. Darkwater]|nr:heat shock protease domain protein [Rickettsia amblyommatis str. Darkwater]
MLSAVRLSELILLLFITVSRQKQNLSITIFGKIMPFKSRE